MKMIIFSWLVWRDKNLTWSNLQKKGKIGPRICSFYKNANEDNLHLFYSCTFTRDVQKEICNHFNVQYMDLMNTEDYITWWLTKGKSLRNIPVLFLWCIWCTRNKWIFEEKSNSPDKICQKIISLWEKLKINQKPPLDLSKRLWPFEIHYPVDFFNGASQ